MASIFGAPSPNQSLINTLSHSQTQTHAMEAAIKEIKSQYRKKWANTYQFDINSALDKEFIQNMLIPLDESVPLP